MGSGASASLNINDSISNASREDLEAAVFGLSNDARSKLKEALDTNAASRGEDGDEAELVASVTRFLQQSPTDPIGLEQPVRFTNGQLIKMIQDVEASCGGDGDEDRIKATVAACGTTVKLSTMLDLIEKARSAFDEASAAKPVAVTAEEEDDEKDNEEVDHDDLDDAFRRIDRHHHGLDLSDLQSSLSLAGASDDEAKILMEHFDTDKNGLLSHDEFERMMATLLADDSAPPAVQKWSKALANFPDLQRRSKEWLDRVVAEQLEKTPEQEKPMIIIPYGPPGSGKSGATKAALKMNGIKREDCIEPNIDTLVRSYMKEVTCNEDMFGDQATYFATRKGWPSKSTCVLMEAAQKSKRHMIVETTGRSTWLAPNVIQPAAEKHCFSTLVVYVLVPLAKIAPRALARKLRTGQGHPPFDELGQTCVKAARNLAAFRDAGGAAARVLFANNAGPYGSLKLLHEKDLELSSMALSEPFQLEMAAMLIRQAHGKSYTMKALEADGLAVK